MIVGLASFGYVNPYVKIKFRSATARLNLRLVAPSPQQQPYITDVPVYFACALSPVCVYIVLYSEEVGNPRADLRSLVQRRASQRSTWAPGCALHSAQSQGA